MSKEPSLAIVTACRIIAGGYSIWIAETAGLDFCGAAAMVGSRSCRWKTHWFGRVAWALLACCRNGFKLGRQYYFGRLHLWTAGSFEAPIPWALAELPAVASLLGDFGRREGAHRAGFSGREAEY